jgi:hypothetical protein
VTRILAGFALAGVLAVVGAARAAEPAPAIEARGVLTPRIALFGDTITARIEVTLDRNRVDPDAVRVSADFSPWVAIEEPEETRRDGETTTYLQTTFVLRCATDPCVPRTQTAQLEFDPARVTHPGGAPIEVRWPVLVVHSRIVSADFQRRDANATPWQADVMSLPAVSYRVSPRLALALLLAGGVLLALGGIVLAYTALPRRAPAPPEPEEPPPPALTPLEQALALLEDPARANGSADQRRALELVAEELDARDAHLAQQARTLAWSQEAPAVRETSGLAARARAALEEESDAPTP